jgi:hypothetical protein
MAIESTNLTMHRAVESVWDRQDSEQSRSRSMALAGFLLIAAGMVLVGTAYKAQLDAWKCRVTSMPKRARRLDTINRAAEASFPASDPPAWTAAIGNPRTPDADQ